MWSQLCNALVNSSTKWLGLTNPMPVKSLGYPKKLKSRPTNFLSGAEELNKILNKCRLDDPEFKYIPAAKTDIRATIKREQKRLEESKREINEKLSG